VATSEDFNLAIDSRASGHSAPDDRSDLIPTLTVPSGAEPSLFATLRRGWPAVAQPTATSPRARACCA